MSGFTSRQLLLALLTLGCICQAQTGKRAPLPGNGETARPLLLEKDEGELRTRRPRPQAMASSQFMLKVTPQNNGSQHLVLGTEEMLPGATIPAHKHLEQDEILLIQSGTAHVWLGDQERDLHAGGLVFIPANTWISLKNAGAEPVSLVFLFSAPGFEDYLRCTSVHAGVPADLMTAEELKHCQHAGHAEFKGVEDEQKK